MECSEVLFCHWFQFTRIYVSYQYILEFNNN